MAPRLPTTPLIGDEVPGLPGTPPGGQNGNDERAPDLLVAVFRPGTPDETPNAFADSLNLRIERSYKMSGLGLRVFLLRLPNGGNADQILRQAANDRRPL